MPPGAGGSVPALWACQAKSPLLLGFEFKKTKVSKGMAIILYILEIQGAMATFQEQNVTD